MRVIAGRLGGRTFDAPKGHRTHPMGDKVRGALFNALGDISGFAVLDAFSGSGALAFEAMSRGAKHVLALDVDSQATNTIQRNIQALGLDGEVDIIRANAKAWSNRHSDVYFDLVLCDPPYNDVQIELVERLSRHLRPNGIIVMSLPPNTRVIMKEPFELLSHKQYGDAELYFYRNKP